VADTAYFVMEEDLQNNEDLVSMHPTHELAVKAMMGRIEQHKKKNPDSAIIETHHYAHYTDSGLTWWRIKPVKL
jgi:hypothetical protein